MASEFHIEPLAAHHDRDGFSSGRAEPDRYLRRVALRDIIRNQGRVFVATGVEADDIAGFYALSALAVAAGSADGQDVSAALLCHLAVSRNYRGRRLGELLLVDALHRCTIHAAAAGIRAIVAQAPDDEATAFYESYGFARFRHDPLRLFLAADTARDVFA